MWHLKMNTEFLTWEYSPRKLKKIRVNVPRMYTINDTNKHYLRRFITISYQLNGLDINKIKNAICANIIHTQEARLMMYWMMLAQKLNSVFQETIKIEFYYTCIYDCFGTNFKHIVLLRYLIEHSYYYCYKHNLFPYIKKIFKDADIKTEINALIKNLLITIIGMVQLLILFLYVFNIFIFYLFI